MRWIRVSLCLAVVLGCVSPARAIIYWGDFDWRNYNGGNYVTPIRNQGSLGSCWAFSATAALESRFLIYNNTPGVDLNLSEQHLECDSSVGMGGHEDLALNYIVSLGITNEATLPYIAKSESPLWPLDRPYTAYKVTSFNDYCASSTAGIKNMLQTYGPLSCAIDTADFFDPGDLYAEGSAPDLDFSLPEWLQGQPDPGVLGPDTPTGGINHSVCVVGYKNEPSMPEGGYWIIKNSWGTVNKGDSGYYFLKYGDIERHNRVHAVTGTPYTVTKSSWAPVGVADAYAVDEDERLVRYTYEGVRANDTDVNTPLEGLTAVKLTDPAHGDVLLSANGSFTYTPDPDFYGADSFKYRAFDGVRYSDATTVTINVASINDVPIAADDFYTCPAGQSFTKYSWEGVFANDYDADNYDFDTTHNDTLSVLVQSGLSHGTITWYSKGAFTYTPVAGFSGTDSLTYMVSDGTALSNLATVVFEVTLGEAAAAAVPEPSAVALLAAAVLGVVAFRRPTPSR